jgi:hypothetical protein
METDEERKKEARWVIDKDSLTKLIKPYRLPDGTFGKVDIEGIKMARASVENADRWIAEMNEEIKKDKQKNEPEENIIDDLLNESKDEQKTRTARMSGKLANGKLYWTIFANYHKKYHAVVIMENDKQPIQVKIDDEGNYYFEYEGITYKYESTLFFKDTYRIRTVSNRAIRLLKEKIDKKKLYDDLLQQVKDFYDHSNLIEYNLLIPDIIITYISWGLGRTFYLIIQGKEDTGKSTLQELLSYLQMNGWFGGKSSVPVMVRLKHFFGISASLDELEKMPKEEKVNFMGVANSGFNINGTYNFVNTNKKKIEDQIQILNSFGYNSFSVNSLNLNWDFDKSFLSRCYNLIATRKNRQTKDIHNLSDDDLMNFQELRDRTLVYCLTHYSEIEKDIFEVKIELEKEGTFGRLTDLYSIILGITKHFKGDYSKEKDELMQKEGLSRNEDLDTIEGAVFDYLSELFTEKKSAVSILNSEICNHINNKLELPEDKKIKSRTIGAILRRFNLTVREDQVKRTSKGYEYVIGFNQFLDMLKRFGYKNQLEKVENRSSELSSLSSLHSLHSFQNEPNELNERNESNNHVLIQPKDFFKDNSKSLWSEEKIDQVVKEKLKSMDSQINNNISKVVIESST